MLLLYKLKLFVLTFSPSGSFSGGGPPNGPPSGPLGLPPGPAPGDPPAVTCLSPSLRLISLPMRSNQRQEATQANSTNARPVKHHPIPIFPIKGSTTAAATAAAGFLNRPARATNVAGVFFVDSVR